MPSLTTIEEVNFHFMFVSGRASPPAPFKNRHFTSLRPPLPYTLALVSHPASKHHHRIVKFPQPPSRTGSIQSVRSPRRTTVARAWFPCSPGRRRRQNMVRFHRLSSRAKLLAQTTGRVSAGWLHLGTAWRPTPLVCDAASRLFLSRVPSPTRYFYYFH